MSCVSGLHMNAEPMSFGFGFWLNWLFAYMGGNLLNIQSLTHTHSNDDIFHDSDKMPKHVEMPTKNWDGQNANHKRKLTKCHPFSWQFICLSAFCLTTWDGVISRTCRAKYFVSLNNDAISY